MPQNKRESLIFTIIMCFTMVLWMSMYNVTLHMGGFSMTVLKEGWLGFPFAYIYAMCFDWFVVSHLAKSVAFRFFVKPDSAPLKKAIAVSCCMVIPMVIVMSFYGSLEACVKSGMWSLLLPVWISCFRYQDKIYRFMVNGQTGKVSGKTPISWIKVALTTIAVIAIIMLLYYLLED